MFVVGGGLGGVSVCASVRVCVCMSVRVLGLVCMPVKR